MNISNRFNQKPIINLKNVNEVKEEIIEQDNTTLKKDEGPTKQRPTEIKNDIKLSNEQILLNNGIKIVSSGQTNSSNKAQGPKPTGSTTATRGANATDDTDETGEIKEPTKENNKTTNDNTEQFDQHKDNNITNLVIYGSGAVGYAIGGPVGFVIGLAVGVVARFLSGLFRRK